MMRILQVIHGYPMRFNVVDEPELAPRPGARQPVEVAP
jgi:hypothetical protein